MQAIGIGLMVCARNTGKARIMQTFPTTQAFDLSEYQRRTLIHALRVAAKRFTEDAQNHGRNHSIAMVVQFEAQAVDAREIADRIESAEYVKLGREVE